LPPGNREFLEKHCLECHDAEVKKGGLDLTALKFDPANSTNFSAWVLVHDRTSKGEMPPKKKARPATAELEAFTNFLASSLISAEQARIAKEGRATQRRLNRYEYENTLRDLLHAPWLQIRDSLPEDGEAYRFNKVGEALDISHVQMARYLSAADYALRQVMAQYPEQPSAKVRRYYARDQRSYTGPMKFSVFNTAPERATFPVLGFEGQPEVRAGKARILRDQNGRGIGRSAQAQVHIQRGCEGRAAIDHDRAVRRRRIRLGHGREYFRGRGARAAQAFRHEVVEILRVVL